IRTEMIRTLAKTTEARIKRIRAEHFQMSAEISFGNSQEIPIEGLNSILTHLGALQAKLRFPPTHRLRQVEEDVDSLLGYLREMALVQGCAPPKLGRDPHKADAPFPITANYLSLLDLQMFLEKLCLNLDKLKPYIRDVDTGEHGT
uniref:Leptin n=1 Tax=Denticeps clupeoides TaxID=299321 RepID=A0AAY4C3S9_9TELE